MNRSQLIESMASKMGSTKKEAERSLKAFIDSLTEALQKGEKVNIIGFGTFEVRERAARMGKNPKTGETIHIEKSRTPALKIGRTYRNLFNEEKSEESEESQE